ncbi:PilZ domain-containing protein [Aestuariibacter halophilus]|uniref:Cyclic diguanosine monophosphate-binding protein n=1 Tax=Fluctibacter halophilus TaxID=226011 RepID=A0ABS8G4D8_9ALTE|nr:PilZ domain-containing protein [Aestuariibacter halophilus]MCC2614715.1 PilZ domain-containing protein [Aestuariibacter halophilus]
MERRRFHRVSFSVNGTAHQQSQQWPIAVEDISLNGALFRCDADDLPILNQPIRLSIPLDGMAAPLWLEGTLCHQQGNLFGLQINQMDISTATTVKQVVAHNLGDETLLQRDLAALIAQH